MQYLIHDLLKLPLEDRLAVVERLICSIRSEEAQQSKQHPDTNTRFFGHSTPVSFAV
ncbi:MAG TPA: hypothetical protein VL092_10320 [Chitinophagaceae bacterium]|nr:hypothetical protein [Chitinophagaceae bacterium]